MFEEKGNKVKLGRDFGLLGREHLFNIYSIVGFIEEIIIIVVVVVVSSSSSSNITSKIRGWWHYYKYC